MNNVDTKTYTHVFTAFGFETGTAERRGSNVVKDRLYGELQKFGFTDVLIQDKDYVSDDVNAFLKAIANKRIYITVHAMTYRGDGPLRFSPRLGIEEHIDNGKAAEHHIQIIGRINSGRTTLAHMLQKVVADLSLTTKVIIVDYDDTPNFYYGNDAEREMYMKNMRQRPINIGVHNQLHQ